jgi:hypothetical protein
MILLSMLLLSQCREGSHSDGVGLQGIIQEKEMERKGGRWKERKKGEEEGKDADRLHKPA